MLTGKIFSAIIAFVSISVSYFYVHYCTKSVKTMANTGLLFVSNINKAHNSLSKVTQYVKKMIYVKVISTEEEFTSAASKQIVNLYTRATAECHDLDVRLILKPGLSNIQTKMAVDTLIVDNNLSSEISNLRSLVDKKQIDLHNIDIEESKPCLEPVKKFDYVVLGGTFDRLHNGHKILLSQAALRTNQHLTVGVTGINMIKRKKLYELIEPVEQRIKSVLDFLTDINPDIDYNVIQIQDMYGPTIHDSKYQLIVASEETMRGVEKINELRLSKNMPILDRYIINLAVENYPGRLDDEEAKVSSSNLRMRLLGTVIKPVVPNLSIPRWPYVIGLAGGIASGKSGIIQRLKSKGAATINCDVVAHELYKAGSQLNQTIEKEFGSDVITKEGEVDRKKLGQIVFSDKSQLTKLNNLVWPSVIEETSRRIQELGEQGYKVVVMEAAVLIQAQWYTRCHQLWSAIVPSDEAIKRIMKRDGLSEEQAKQRIDSQPSNLEQVAHANVVFSPLWSHEHTDKQVDRAWTQLLEYLQSW